jgi:uncharacterized protein (TIGR00661 family)
MARIIYGVQGEGRGHSSRSLLVIQHLLERGHEVRVFTSHKAYAYLKENLGGVNEIFGLAFEFEGEKVDILGTLRRNVRDGTGEIPETFRRMIGTWSDFRPQAAITDFEPFVPFARTLLQIPFVSIDHQHVLTQYRPEYPHAWRSEFLQARAVVDAMYFGADHYYTTSFYYPPTRSRYQRRATLVPPILRREVLTRTPRHDGPILLYATTAEARHALELLRGRTERCVAYGFRREGDAGTPELDRADGNIEFRHPSTEQFLSDLASARAVIANGGYTLMSEALFLGKPVYALPIRNQFEQMLNGWYLERLGYGLFDLDPAPLRLSMFLEGLDYYRANIERDRRTGVPGFTPEAAAGDRFCGNAILFDSLDRWISSIAD